MNVLIYFFFFLFVSPLPLIAAEMHPWELLLLLLALITCLQLVFRKPPALIPLDWMVMAYLGLGLLAVFIGASRLYDSARIFRWNVFVPVLLYVSVRFCQIPDRVLWRGLYFMLPGLCWHGLILLKALMASGLDRASASELLEAGSHNTITLSYLMALGCGLLVFYELKTPSLLRRAVVLAGAVIFMGLTFLTYTRTSIIGILLFIPAVLYVWKRRNGVVYFGSLLVGTMVLSCVFILLSKQVWFDYSAKDARMTAHSAGRIVSIDGYLGGIEQRAQLIGELTSEVLRESPLFGMGMAAAEVGYDFSYKQSYGSAHNIFVTVLRVFGGVGLLYFLLLNFGLVNALQKIAHKSGAYRMIGKCVLFLYGVLLLGGFTNDLVTGGRMAHFFLLVALAARFSIETEQPIVIEKGFRRGERRLIGKRQPNSSNRNMPRRTKNDSAVCSVN